MADQNKTVIISADMEFDPRTIEILIEKAETTEEVTKSERIGGLGAYVLQSIADGAVLLEPSQLHQIEESTGVRLGSWEDVLQVMEKAASRRAGCRIVEVPIDPTLEPSLEEISLSQGREIGEILWDVVQWGMENGLAYAVTVPIAHVLMSTKDKEELEELLGGKFQNGTELAELVRKTQEPVSLFEEAEA